MRFLWLIMEIFSSQLREKKKTAEELDNEKLMEEVDILFPQIDGE